MSEPLSNAVTIFV